MRIQQQTYSDGSGNPIIGILRYSERNYKLVDVKYYNSIDNTPYSGDLFNVNSPVLDSNLKPLWEVKTLANKSIYFDIYGAEYNGSVILGGSVADGNYGDVVVSNNGSVWTVGGGGGGSNGYFPQGW